MEAQGSQNLNKTADHWLQETLRRHHNFFCLHPVESFADFWATDRIMFVYSAGFGDLSNIWRHESLPYLIKSILKGITTAFLYRKDSHKQRLVLTKM